MDYLLVILFFVTPPAQVDKALKDTDKDPRVWTLQSTTTLEVSSQDWCKAAAESIQRTMLRTATLTTRAYCIPKVGPAANKLMSGNAEPKDDYHSPDRASQAQINARIDRLIRVEPTASNETPTK